MFEYSSMTFMVCICWNIFHSGEYHVVYILYHWSVMCACSLRMPIMDKIHCACSIGERDVVAILAV